MLYTMEELPYLWIGTDSFEVEINMKTFFMVSQFVLSLEPEIW